MVRASTAVRPALGINNGKIPRAQLDGTTFWISNSTARHSGSTVMAALFTYFPQDYNVCVSFKSSVLIEC